MIEDLETDRLTLKKLSLSDAPFIFDLVNTDGWIRFIGDRNIKDIHDAEAYITKIQNDPNIDIWTVTLRTTEMPIGIVTFIKKKYLPFHDIGFAFLPDHHKKGYAFESGSKLLDEIFREGIHRTVLAVTLKENTRSINVLEKLGFILQKEQMHENQLILVFSKERLEGG